MRLDTTGQHPLLNLMRYRDNIVHSVQGVLTHLPWLSLLPDMGDDGDSMRQPGHGSNRVRNPPEIIHVDQGRLDVSQQLVQTTYTRVPTHQRRCFSPGRQIDWIGRHMLRQGHLAQGTRFGARDGWMPDTPVQSAQECDQITLRPTNRPNPVHVENSCAHYRVSG